MTTEKWRNHLTKEQIEKYINFVRDMHEKRMCKGIDKYGQQFQGEPIDQAMEEAFDLVRYLYVANQQITELKAELKAYKDLLESFGIITIPIKDESDFRSAIMELAHNLGVPEPHNCVTCGKKHN